VVFNVGSFLAPPAFALLPLSDAFNGPTLGMLAVENPDTGENTLANLEVCMLAYDKMIDNFAEESPIVSLLGHNWNNRDQRQWARTMFLRIAGQATNAMGQKVGLAAGVIHVQIPPENRFFDDIEPLMRKGRVAYAPFVSISMRDKLVSNEGVLKADILNSSLIATKPQDSISGKQPMPVLNFDIPYLEGIPLPLLAKVLDDEGESLAAFRRKLDRTLEDIASAKDAAEVDKSALKFKRDELEDELERVRQTCGRIARMNSIARSGTYVAVTALSVAGYFGLAHPSVIAGCSAPIVTALKAFYDAYESRRELRRSSMHFVWRLSKSQKRSPSQL
jgi:hypothetical protein